MKSAFAKPALAMFLCSFLALTMARAQDAQEKPGDKPPPEESCDGGTADLVRCLQEKTTPWDKRLNEAYQESLKDAVSNEQREQLRRAQRAWVAYRDANCLFYRLGEGSIAQVDAATCILSMTESRARELEGEGHRN
jgi:uncharacterized protein YecT (DUF1311 family)